MCCANEEANDTTTAAPETTTKAIIVETTTEAATTEPKWLTELKKKVPQAPDCGIDSPDRLFGGSRVEIDSHSWNVLLYYETRECYHQVQIIFIYLL